MHADESSVRDRQGHCRVAAVGACQLPLASDVLRSEGSSEVVEGDADPIRYRQVDGDRVVAAAQVLHEGMPGRDGGRGREVFESAPGP